MVKKLVLTDHEARMLDALCELGETDLVARKLRISPRTVGTYIARIMAANNYPNRLMLALARDRENRSK
jgi:DNA-binding CsgD family transcriptional regulator